MFNAVLAYIAGIVSILSPCVLPLLPIIIVSSFNAHKKGPFALAAGLVISFTLAGLFIATIGLSIGLNQFVLQQFSAMLLVVFGIIMVYKPFYQKFASVASRSVSGANSKISKMDFNTLKGQFWLGILLGSVWTPCVGPTLGSAIGLATQGENIPYAAMIMFSFAVGVVTPVIIMSLLSQSAMFKFKNALMSKAETTKTLLGILFITLGLLILTGGMVLIENFFIDHVFSTALIEFIYQF
jgi:cytochrome c biogenesis protein CcdA|tara:strand:- start:14 stop:733 length:720 start_codon:yes stop_codon:yes gene_type:complete